MIEDPQRRLAAIVSVDVVGYSRMMGEDEAGTLAALRAHREALIDPSLTENQGRVVKTMGDGLLLEFASIVNATRCAVAIQSGMAARNGDPSEARGIEYRIGINLGDVIVEGEDIFGDGVNVAARLQEIAAPGGIAISARVHDDVRDRLDIVFTGGGERALKNIARPIPVWFWHPETTDEAAIEAGEAQPVETSLAAVLASVQPPTLAVLPFANMSRSEEIEFFCDGLTESLITDLSRSLRLKVAARNASFALKGEVIDARRVGERLGVRYLIEGGVQAMGRRMRINAQLIDAASGDPLWADRFDRDSDDLFAVQDELCDAILVATDVAVSSGEMARERSHGTDSPEARRHALRASIYHGRFTHKDLITAQEEADKAIAIDPDFQGALMMAAVARLVRLANGWTSDNEQLLREAFELTERMIEVVGESGTALGLRAFAHNVAGDFDAAVADIERSVAASPNIGGVRLICARIYFTVGRFDAAYREIIEALTVQPNIFPFALAWLGVICLMRDEPSSASAALEKSFELGMNEIDCYPWLAAARTAEGDSVEARRLRERLLSIDPNFKAHDAQRRFRLRDPAHEAKLQSLLRAAGLAER